jgi:hypothetical protein
VIPLKLELGGLKFITALCNGHAPTDTLARSGVQVAAVYATALNGRGRWSIQRLFCDVVCGS